MTLNNYYCLLASSCHARPLVTLTRLRAPLRTFALIVLACLGIGTFGAPASAQTLLVMGEPTLRAGTAIGPNENGQATSIVRERPISLKLGEMPKRTEAAATDTIWQFQLFDDVLVSFELQRTESTSDRGFAYIGKVVGEPLNTAVIVDNQGVVSGHFVVKGIAYSLQGNSASGYVARELRPHGRPDHPPTSLISQSKMATDVDVARSQALLRELTAATPPQTSAAAVAIPADTGATIDVMVVYTQAARAANGGDSQIRANVDAQIALTNTVYANSNVTHRLRLVYKGEIQYREANMDTDLPRLATTDGYMDEVQALRDQYGADLVSLWGVYTDACGLGYLMQTEALSFEPLGYNVVASPACTSAGQYTFAHELGHNMGLRHDKFVDAAATVVSPEGSGSLSTIGFAHGYVDMNQRFRTVMAYEDQCIASAISCPRVPYFSNPALTYNTAPLGDAANAHEQRALNHTRDTVANFRQAAFLGGTVGFPQQNIVARRDAEILRITVRRTGGTTGQASVGYATVNGTAVAGIDFEPTVGIIYWSSGDDTERFIDVPIIDSAVTLDRAFTVRLESLTTSRPGIMISTVVIRSMPPIAPVVSYPMMIRANSSLWTGGGPQAVPNAPEYRVGGFNPSFASGTGWSKVASQRYLYHGIKSDGSLWEWSQRTVYIQTQVGQDSGWAALSRGANDYRAAAIRSDGTLWLTFDQDSNYNYLPNGPVQLGTSTGWNYAYLYSGYGINQPYSYGIKGDGTLWTVAEHAYVGPTLIPPYRVGTESNWSRVSCSQYNGCMSRKTDGSLWIGPDSRGAPVRFGTDGDWSTEFGLVSYTGYAIKNDGSLWAWAIDANQIVNNYRRVGLDTDWSSVRVDDYVTLSKKDGSLWRAAYNTWGPDGLFMIAQAGPGPSKCNYQVSTDQINFGSSGGTTTFRVSTTPICWWYIDRSVANSTVGVLTPTLTSPVNGTRDFVVTSGANAVGAAPVTNKLRIVGMDFNKEIPVTLDGPLVVPACGTANGVTTPVAPTANFCSAGTASPVYGTGPWGWGCGDPRGSNRVHCTAPKTGTVITATPVCGIASTSKYAVSPPSDHLCAAGLPTNFTGVGSWNWKCNGAGALTTNCTSSIFPPKPVNDDLINATIVTGAVLQVTGQNVSASAQTSEVSSGASVWWRWVAPNSAMTTVSLSGSNFDTFARVYTGTNFQDLVKVAENDNANGAVTYSEISFAASAGTTYLIQVDGVLSPGYVPQPGVPVPVTTGNVALQIAQQVNTLPTDGVCGSAHGVVTPTVPVSNQCRSGSPSAITGYGPWVWSCYGTSGGQDTACGAPIQQYVVTFDSSSATSAVSLNSQLVSHGQVATVASDPLPGMRTVFTGTCPSGSFNGTTYSTGQIVSACTLNITSACGMDVNGNGKVDMSDALAIVRVLLGVPTASIAQGLRTAGSTRTDQQIAAHAQAVVTSWSAADGGAAKLAATDGVALLRALMGYSSAGVVAGLSGVDWNALRAFATSCGAQVAP